ncbi:MAG: hypothetical protein AAFY20_10645 [Cyanobacteria bacterium J06639_14]
MQCHPSLADDDRLAAGGDETEVAPPPGDDSEAGERLEPGWSVLDKSIVRQLNGRHSRYRSGKQGSLR